MMSDCEYNTSRTASLSVAQWREMMGLPAACKLTSAQECAVVEALLQADEDAARYVGWWPAATTVTEELAVRITYQGCFFAQAGRSRWITLRFGKIQSVEKVLFLRRHANDCTAPASDDEHCHAVDPGAICVIDAEYGAVELDVRAVGTCQCPPEIDRVRLCYISGDVTPGQAPRFAQLLARYAATLLPSPFLCGVDLRFDQWENYTLTDGEVEHKQEDVFGSDLKLNDRTITDRTLSKTKQQRRAQNPKDWQSPFGPTWAGVQLWRYLKSRRRVRAFRL